MNIKKIISGILFLLVFIEFSSCKKFLDEKADKRSVVATTITDAQALNDQNNSNSVISGGLISYMDDDFYIQDTYYDIMSAFRQLAVKWDPATSDPATNYSYQYLWISQANVALETLGKITPGATEIDAYNLAKGGALVLRACHHYGLLMQYAKAYNSSTATTDLGIPYKKTSDINDPTARLSIKDSYDNVIADFKEAAKILPNITDPITRGSKAAAYGMLARVYLSMSDFSNAGAYADSALKYKNTLMDYNNFLPYSTTALTSPFPMYTSEDIFHCNGSGGGLFGSANCICDSLLYKSYDDNDLRKSLFFAKTTNGPNTFSFRGTYDRDNPTQPYSGIATDEMLLIRAESFARNGNTQSAMADLNTLLKTRWKAGTFVDLKATSSSDAVKIILQERRKELVQRDYLRWSDLKRLNLDPAFAKTLNRTIKGVQYSLPPNDLRYQVLFDPVVIQSSGIQQNPR